MKRLLALLLFCTASSQAAQTLHIDSAQSHASFSVPLFWISHIEGRMDTLRGQLRIDDAGNASVDVQLDVAHAKMDNPRRAAMLRSKEFFDTARFPFIRFRSSEFPQALLWRGGTIDGQLSMRGTTRQVQFTLQPAQCERDRIVDCLIRASGEVRRTDFGMDAYRVALGNDVQLHLVIGLRQ